MRLPNHPSARMPKGARAKRGVRGSAVIEMALLAPWFLFLFIGIVDMGFYTHQLIAVENAARVAAEYTATGDSVADDTNGACSKVLLELASLPNLSGVSTCGSLPLVVTAAKQKPSGIDGTGEDTTVTVTYQTTHMIPIPNLLTSQFTFSRIVVARVKP